MAERIDRRVFLKSGAAATAALAGSLPAAASAAVPGKPLGCREPARELPVVEHDDVVVCGAGPAGVAAAIAAARSGAKTRLLEVNGCLGGVWTAGLLSWILDSGNKGGLMREILARLDQRDSASARFGSSVGYDVEQMKILLEEMCLEAGVQVRLHTQAATAPPVLWVWLHRQ